MALTNPVWAKDAGMAKSPVPRLHFIKCIRLCPKFVLSDMMMDVFVALSMYMFDDYKSIKIFASFVIIQYSELFRLSVNKFKIIL